jgi:exosortase family protein XrtF
MNWDFIKKNTRAIQFLLVFIGLYFGLNTAYGFFIQYYYPGSDPFTRLIASQVVWLLSFFDPSIAAYPSQFSESIAVANDRENMIYVFEGCNGLNVLIVYLSFLLAFAGPRKLLIRFIVVGMIGIHLLNIGRVCLLYGVVFYFPDQVYFFHKYLFTGILYIFVFLLWYLWVRKVRNA